MSLFSIICISWVVSEIILSRIKKANREEEKDKSSLKIIWITIVLSITVVVLINKQNIGQLNLYPDMVHAIGIILIICGLIIRWIAILSLRKYFTVQVTIKEDHELVQKGMFKLIRHPAYLGSLISFFGLGVAFVNWLGLIIIFIPILFAFLNRISVEEKVLIESFGEKYLQYIKNSKKLIPGIY